MALREAVLTRLARELGIAYQVYLCIARAVGAPWQLTSAAVDKGLAKIDHEDAEGHKVYAITPDG